jgi:hypothetical protein
MSHDVDAIVERITALRELTKATGTVTTKTQNQILQALPSDVLAEVAVRLKRASMLAALSGTGEGR